MCRIADFGKFKYEEKKKEQASRRKQHQVQVKELRVRPEAPASTTCRREGQARVVPSRTATRCSSAASSAADRWRTRMSANEVINNVVKHLADIAKVERGVRQEGRRMVLLLSKKWTGAA